MPSREYADMQDAINAKKLVQQLTKYPGTASIGAGEVNGAQNVTTSFATNEQKMLQTLWDMARAAGLLA